MKKLNLLVLFTFVLLACNNGQKFEKGEQSFNQASRSIISIQSEVYNGNVDSYIELRNIYLDMPQEDFLFWALLMSNKYDYAPAYLDVYYAMKNGYEKGGTAFSKRDKLTNEFLLKYLNIAINKNVDGAKEELRKLKEE